MLSINGKQDRDNKIYVRRVLLEYKGKDIKTDTLNNVPICYYVGTRFIEKDPYFKDPSKHNQYSFNDSSYSLTKTDYVHNMPLTGEERQYHSFAFETSDPYYKALSPFEFEANSDEEAIKKFNEREELR